MASRRRRKDLRKQERARGRGPQGSPEASRRRLPQQLPYPTKIITAPPGAEKMSEILEEFVAPFLDEGLSDGHFRKAMALGVCAWNVALYPEGQRAEAIDEVARSLIPEGDREAEDACRTFLGNMIAHKLAHYAANRRRILSYELIHEGGRYHLSVLSTPGHEAPDAP